MKQEKDAINIACVDRFKFINIILGVIYYLQSTGENMVQCEKKGDCEHGEWFHFECIGMMKAPPSEC